MKIEEDNPRPRIKLKLMPFDRMVEFAALIFLLALIILPVLYYNVLPERMPVHFNASGIPDDYGGKATLFFLPGTGLLLYLLMTLLAAFPHVFHFAVKITPENAEIQYRLATRLIRILKTVILLMFSFISYKTIQTITGGAAGLGKVFLPVFLILTFGVVIIYLVQSNNNRAQS